MKEIRPLWPALLLASASVLLSACNDDHDRQNDGSGDDALTADLSFTAPGASVDIANYALVGRYALPTSNDPANLLAAEASAVSYDKDSDSLYVVGDGGTSVVQVDKTDGSLISSMALAAGGSSQGTEFYDTEGITYAGNGQFVLVEERYRQANLFTYAAGATLQRSDVQTVKLGSTIGNIGLEGASLDPVSGGYIFVKEKDPIAVFQTAIDFSAGTATNGSASTEPQNLFNAAHMSALAVADLADVFVLANVTADTDPEYKDLLLLSQESGVLLQTARDGTVKGRLDIDLNAQNEGVTMDGDHTLYLVNELGNGHPQLWVYKAAASKDAVGVGSNLYLTFSKDVATGNGYIVLDDGADDVRTIKADDDDQVQVDGRTITINPERDLLPGHHYRVTITDGAFRTADGQDIGNVGGLVDLSFTTAADTLPPQLLGSDPVDDAPAVTGNTITLTFDEAVQAGNGNIVITGADGDVRTIAIGDAQIAISGKTVTITPDTALHSETAYDVTVASGVITDTAGNAWPGISSHDALNFTMAAPNGPSTLSAGDLLFVGANSQGDDPDAIAFMLMKPINAGTVIGLTDKDYIAASASWDSGEAAYTWTADHDYPAGTIVTIQADEKPPVADHGTTNGDGGGLGKGGETYYAFQGTITDADAGDITVTHFLATLHVGASASGDIPAEVTAAYADIEFSEMNARFKPALIDTSDLVALRARIVDTANWDALDNVSFALSASGSLFPDMTTGTTLDAGDLLFVGANSDGANPDVIAFALLKDISAGTQICFTDKDYAPSTATPWGNPGSESGYTWTADQDYAAGTIVTIQPDTLIVDKGSVTGVSGGLGKGGETYYAFQGTITAIDSKTAEITKVDRFLAAIHVADAAATGEIPAELTAANAYIGFTENNVKYTGSLDATDIAAFKARIQDAANWTKDDLGNFALTGDSLFP